MEANECLNLMGWWDLVLRNRIMVLGVEFGSLTKQQTSLPNAIIFLWVRNPPSGTKFYCRAPNSTTEHHNCISECWLPSLSAEFHHQAPNPITERQTPPPNARILFPSAECLLLSDSTAECHNLFPNAEPHHQVLNSTIRRWIPSNSTAERHNLFLSAESHHWVLNSIIRCQIPSQSSKLHHWGP